MIFKLIEGASIGDLETQVNAALVDGWQLQGGVCVALDRHADCQGYAVVSWSFHQAMFKL